MDAELIARYQSPTGDIYNSLSQSRGVNVANAAAAAALTGDRVQVTNAIANAEYGPPLNESTADILYTQLATDPFRAPLEGLDNILGNSFKSFLTSPYVVGIALVGVTLYFIPPQKIKEILTSVIDSKK